MPLHRPAYRLTVDTPGANDADRLVVHEVVVLPGDQLRAETEGNRRGLADPARQGVMLTLLWLWAACRRLQLVAPDTDWQTFVDHRLTGWERVKPADDAETGEAAQLVDPTHEAASSTPASSSLPASPALTGSDSSTTTPHSSPQVSDSSTATTPTEPGIGEVQG